MTVFTKLFNVLHRLLHRMRVSFGFTFDDHSVFGVDNMLLHWLLYDGWGLPDCRQRNESAECFSNRCDKMMHIIIKTCIALLTHLPEECPEPKHSATKAAAVLIWPVSPSLWCMESSKTFPHQFSCSEIKWRTTEDMHMHATFMLCGPEQNTFGSHC